jgi:hypothetical protein
MSKMNKTETNFVNRSVTTTSSALNNQPGVGGMKPLLSGGKDNPGGCKPPANPSPSVPIPNGRG